MPAGTRVTLRLPPKMRLGEERSGAPAAVVSPHEPREAMGLRSNWGYNVRVASSLPAVWSECPYDSGYDLSVGTSQNGEAMGAEFTLPSFQHLLIVFGGVEGLEPVVEADAELSEIDVEAGALFDTYLNLCPQQGSRTIRTEEALLLGLGALRPHVERANVA